MASIVILLFLVAVLATVVSFKLTILVRVSLAVALTYASFFIYYVLGIYINNKYEPEMLIGGLLISTVGSVLVVALTVIFTFGINKYLNRKSRIT